MQIKDIVLEIKDAVFNDKELDFQKFSEYGISQDRVLDYYKDIIQWHKDENEDNRTMTKKKIWSDSEESIVAKYVADASLEAGNKSRKKPNTEIFKELEEILIDRKDSSISFQYYHHIREKYENKNREDVKPPIQLKSKSDEESKQIELIEEDSKVDSDDDLLNIMSNLIDNTEKVGIDAVDLFKNLLQFSSKAVENNVDYEKIDKLEGEVEFYKQELKLEQEKNKQLQLEVSNIIEEFAKVKKEVDYFVNLSGKQRLTNISNFSNKLKYMVDKFGGVISVEEDKVS